MTKNVKSAEVTIRFKLHDLFYTEFPYPSGHNNDDGGVANENRV